MLKGLLGYVSRIIKQRKKLRVRDMPAGTCHAHVNTVERGECSLGEV